MTHDPYWKIALNWGAVITFFCLPLLVFISQFTIFPDLATQKADLDYLRTFQTNITLLVFGLAGLKSWEQIKNGSIKLAQPPTVNKAPPQTSEANLGAR